MNKYHSAIAQRISGVSSESWKHELEKTSTRYHITGAWAAIIFDPVFAVTDYYNIPENWRSLLVIRLCVSFVTLIVLLAGRKRQWPSFVIVLVPFMLISLQNAYTFSLIGDEDLLVHNLNFMALLIGAAMFLAWGWTYSVGMIIISAIATALFIHINDNLEFNVFFVKGGLLLLAVAVFMVILIKTRYDLTIREIKARLALQASNEEIQAQDEEMKRINENLEDLVHERMQELEKKNAALEEYAFITAHKLRSPVASILGLTNLIRKIPAIQSNEEAKVVCEHLEDSTQKLNNIVRSITVAIEKGDK
jgi:signal transduction histidine kinase